MWEKWMITLSGIVMIAGICFAVIFPYFIPQAIEPFFTEITSGTRARATISLNIHFILSLMMRGELDAAPHTILFTSYPRKTGTLLY